MDAHRGASEGGGRPGKIRRLTQLYLQQADGSTLTLELTRHGELYEHQTLSKCDGTALWYLQTEDDILAAIADRRAVRRQPHIPDERVLIKAIEAQAAQGNRLAQTPLKRARQAANVAG